MKVAVSIPDPVFAEAELLAKRMNTSRSDVYARALAAYVGTHLPDQVTAAMNAVLDDLGQEPDAFVREAARQAVARIEW